MRYKFTQLNELPDSPVGTIVRCLGIVYNSWAKCDEYEMVNECDNTIFTVPVGKTIYDNPKWYRKEIDYRALVNIKCPRCGDTKGVFITDSYYVRDLDRDDYGINYEVGFECVCGYIYPLINRGGKRNNIKYSKRTTR